MTTIVHDDKKQAVLVCDTATGECLVNSLEWVQFGNGEIADGNGWRSLGVPAPSGPAGTIRSTPATGKDESKEDIRQLLGGWLATSVDVGKFDDKPKPEDFHDFDMLVYGNTMIFGKEHQKSSFQLDPKKSPKAIDLTTRGKIPLLPGLEKNDEKPQRLLGIYSLEGDRLTLCLQEVMSELGRPEEFKGGPGRFLTVFKRIPFPLQEDDLREQADVVVTGTVTKAEISEKKPPSNGAAKEEEHRLTVAIGKAEKGKLPEGAKTVDVRGSSIQIESAMRNIEPKIQSKFGHNSTNTDDGIAAVEKGWELRLYLKRAAKGEPYTIVFPNGFEVLKKPSEQKDK